MKLVGVQIKNIGSLDIYVVSPGLEELAALELMHVDDLCWLTRVPRGF